MKGLRKAVELMATLAATMGAAETIPADAEMARRLRVPDAVIEAALAAPLASYGRRLKGGGHTDAGWNGGWQIALALAAWTGDTRGDAKLLERIEWNLRGDRCISANGGYPAQHELNVTAMYTILRQSPRFWEGRLTAEQRSKIDRVMKAALVASAYTTSDATYAGGRAPTALDGDTNLHRGWNPNFREGLFGGLLVGAVYFGGVENARKILDEYRHTAFVAELKAAGLTNTAETFDYARLNPRSGAPSGDQIERAVRGYRYNGQPLMGPFELYRFLTLHTYGGTVQPGLNGGRGIVVDGVATGTIVAGADRLPNRGAQGMLLEFDSRDANGPRSSIHYAYDGFRPNLANRVAVIVGGYWPRSEEARELTRRVEIGVADLRYKLEQGYRDYSKGKGSKSVFDITAPHWEWSFRTSLPLWTDVLLPFHRATDR